MKEKIEKENIIRTKSEKGAITLFVLLACLFFVFTLTGVYISNVNRLKSQEQDIKQIQENYKRELDNIDEIYEEISSKGITVTLTKEPEEWTKTVTLKGIGEVQEGENLEIVEYAFTKDEKQPSSTDWKSAEESEKTKIEKTDEVTENGKYIFWVKDSEGNIYKSNEVEVKNIDKLLPTPGSIIAKKDTSDGEEYIFDKWTDTDVYVEKVDGTDGESGHKSTTITVQKNGITMSEYTNVEGPITLTENGTYTITVTTEDNSGNKATSEPYIVKIDKVIPVLALKHNDASGADYEQGTWTKDNLYGEITIDTSNNGKTVEKYQYSYNGITWNDISEKITSSNIDYTTTFPMGGDKPSWISGPINNGTYYFEVQSDGTLKPNNSGKNSTTANSYFEIDLTNNPEAKLEITLNATSSSDLLDYGYATITTDTNAPAAGSSTGQFIKESGSTKTKNYTTTLTGGQKYYLHIGYSKNLFIAMYQDTFIINSITLKASGLEKKINFYNYQKQDNKVTFNFQEDMEEEIYIRAVYNSTENDTSRYTEKQAIKIDTIAPVIESAETIITSKTNAKVNVKIVEENSGMKGYYISTENIAPTEQSAWTEQVLKEFTIEGLKTDTTHYLWVIDNAGNISEKQEIVIGSANYLVDGKISTKTLEEAITVATDGSTIQLLGDYTDTSTATFSKNITFDVQSYTLTRQATITINSGKTVEITGTGKITTESNNVSTINNNGTLTISNSITIENLSTTSSNVPIYTNSSNSITNINDNAKIIGYYKGIYNYYGTLNVNGGYIEATYQNSSAYGIYNYSRSTVKTYIKGGEIRGYNGIYNGSSSTLEMTDGKVVGTGAYGIAGYGTTNIYGGRIEGKTYGLYSNESNKITFGRQEDELSTITPAVYGETYGIYLNNETYSFNFYNGKIISNTKETAYRGQANLRIEHMPHTYFDYYIEQRYCTILTPKVESIKMEATPTEFTNENVTVKITYPYTTDTKQYSENKTNWIETNQNIQEIIVTENKTIYARTINESGMVTDENQIVINNIDKEKPTVIVTPTQTNYTVTETNGTVDLNISITAQDTGVSGLNVMQYAWAREGEEPKYIDFNNTVTIDKTKLEIGQYYLYINVTDKAGNKADLVQMRYNVKYQEPVAQIGSTKYTTVQLAVNACSKSAGNTQTTIIMLKSTDEEFTTYEGQNIKLDLKGYTIGSSNMETPICTNNGTLQIVDTSTNKTGKLESLNGTAIQNNGTITIGDNSTSIENDVPTIYGYKIGIENNNIFNFYDGKIQSITPIKGNVTDTPEEYGPVSTNYNNGITTVQLGIVSGYEARIEWVYYTTVQEAVDATRIYNNNSRDTVTIIKDIQLKETLNISASKNMILDLDGYILTITSEKDIVVDNNGNLEVTDSSMEQSGEITINSLKEGTYSSRISTIVINNNNSGRLIISGGTLNSILDNSKYYYYNSAYGIYNKGDGTVEVTGGTINSCEYGVYNAGSGTILISGGIIDNIEYASYGIYNASSGTVLITGGDIIVDYSANTNTIGIYNQSVGNIRITGGRISTSSGKMATYGIINKGAGTVEVIGGIISSDGSAAYGIENKGEGTIEITGGTINCRSDGEATGIRNMGTGIIRITDGLVNCSCNSFSGSYGINNMDTGRIEVIGGTVSSSSEKTAYGIYNNSGVIIIGEKENPIIQKEKPLIAGKNLRQIGDNTIYRGNGIYNNKGELEIYNGTIQGNIALSGGVNKIKEGCMIESNIIDNFESIYLVEKINTEYIAQIDEKKYYTLNEAIENIQQEEKTIQILKDFELNEIIEFNKNIILDLNGHTITNKYYKIFNIGNLTITDNTVNKQGKIDFIETIIGIENKDIGNLIISGGTISSGVSEGDSYAIYNTSSGNIQVTEGKIINKIIVEPTSRYISALLSFYGIYNENNGSIEINGGEILNEYVNEGVFMDSTGIYNVANGNIKMTGGIINCDSAYSYPGAIGISNQGGGTIEIAGGRINVSCRANGNATGIRNLNGGKVRMTGGTVSSSVYNDSAYGIYNSSSSTLEMTGGKIEVTGGTVNTSSDDNGYGIYNKDNGTIIMTGGTISSTAYEKAYGIYNAKDTETITIGIKGDGAVLQDEPSIIGKCIGTLTDCVGYGIYNTQGKLYYYDGRIEGSTKAIYDFITEREENTELNYNENETIVTLTTNSIDIAQVGDIKYKTIQEAINVVGTNQTTIKILRNATYTVNDARIIIPKTKNIILDLNGFKINSSIKEALIQNEGILEIIDNSEQKNGNLISNTETTIKNLSGAKLTITEGTIENIKQTTIHNEGELIINGGKVINNIGFESEKNSYVIYNTNSGNVEVISGIIENNNNNDVLSSNQNTNYFGIFSNSTGYVKISGGTIRMHNYCYYSKNINSYGVYNANSGKIIILDGIIENNNQYDFEHAQNEFHNNAYGIYNASSGSIEILSGKISSSMVGNDEAEGSHSYIYSDIYGVYNAENGDITIGTKGQETILQEEPIIIGMYKGNDDKQLISYGIYNKKGSLFYYDGKIQGKDGAINGKATEIEDATEFVVSKENIDNEELQTVTLKLISTNAVTMNGTEYDSLAKAINASGSEQNTIKLLRDTGPGTDSIIESNQNIIIDLNGYTLSNYNEITNNGILKIIDTSSGKNGKIKGIVGIAISNNGTIELNSGAIADSTYGIKNTGTLNITGGKIENNTYGIYNTSNGIVTMLEGEITSNTYGIYNYANTSTTNITGGIISSNEYGFYNYNGTTNIDTIEMLSNTYGIYNAGGTTNVNSMTVTGITYGIYNSSGTTNIKEGSQVQSQTGIYVANGRVNIGEQGTMNPDSPIIIGENFGLEVSPTGVVYMYDGQIKGKRGATQGFITHTETGYAVANKVEGEYFVDYLALAGTISTVAEVNGVSFSNLQSAINSVVGTEPQTVKLTNGIISTMTFNIAEGQNIILDMNGKTISSDLDVTMNNAGTLVIIDSASSGVAKISSTVGTAINNTGTLILGQDDGAVSQDLITIEGQTYGITTSGTLSFYDGTINGASAVNGTVTNRPSGYVIRTTTVNGKERYYLSV